MDISYKYLICLVKLLIFFFVRIEMNMNRIKSKFTDILSSSFLLMCRILSRFLYSTIITFNDGLFT